MKSDAKSSSKFEAKAQPRGQTGAPGGSFERSRRAFLGTGATAAAAVATSALPRRGFAAPATGRVIGANDRITVAYIGTGSRGTSHVKMHKDNAGKYNIALAGVCDLYQKRLDRARAIAGCAEKDAVRDYRRLLERKDIDAVVIATVDNWHADVAVDALEAGKHVYGEKPLARYLDEGFRIADTIKRTKKTFQIGSQYCADDKYHKVAEWIRAGKLGPLAWAQGAYCRNNPKNSEWTYPIDADANETNLDWNRWLGKAPKRAFTPEHYFSWHKFYAYNSGILGNLLSHTFLPLLLASGANEMPRRVVCTGTRKVSTDREITDTTHLLAEMPSGLTFMVAGSTINEQGLGEMIRGRKATAYLGLGQNKAELKVERPFAEQQDNEEFVGSHPPGSTERLAQNFFDCVRSGKTPVGNIDLALRAHTILALAEMSERMSMALLFDEKTRTILTGDGRVLPALSYDTQLPRGT
jgi:predicted dehydrogenase